MSMNLSFAGCGFLGIYHVGVVSCFKEYAPNLVKQISGASAGALAACSLLCDLPLGQITSDTLKVSVTARAYRLGPFNPRFDVNQILQERLREILPPDAYLKCRGRLHISCTRVSDGKNVILNEFDSNEELIQALICSSFIPVFSGIIPPTYRGARYIDGCYSDNLPILDENTITVSPFCGDCDICPRDNSYNLLLMNLANTSIELSTQNLYRFLRVLFPPHPEMLSEMCKQGFQDAMSFLKRKNLISCARCISINSTMTLNAQDNNTKSQDETRVNVGAEDSCNDCELRKQTVRLDDVPESVLTVLQEACTSINQGFINWVCEHRSVKILSALSIPYVLPLDIAYVVFVKFLELAPKLSQDFHRMVCSLITYVKNVLKKINGTRSFYSAKFTCQLAMTEYNYQPGESDKAKSEVRAGSHDAVIPVSDADSRSTPCDRVMGRVNIGITVDVNADSSSDGDDIASRGYREANNCHNPLSSAVGADSKERTTVNLANAARVWDSQHFDSISDSSHFEIVEVMRTHDALMSYYYLDENQQMKVTDIYNVEASSDVPVAVTSNPEFPPPENEQRFLYTQAESSAVFATEGCISVNVEASNRS